MIDIRRAAEKDIDGIADIESQQFPHPWKEGYFRDELSHDISCFLVAVEREGDGETGSIAGYIIFWIVQEILELHKIAVSPLFQRKGIGRKLFQKMLDTAREREVSEIFLEVRASNEAAVKLYEGFGFKQISVRQDYYSQPVEDALIFKLEI